MDGAASTSADLPDDSFEVLEALGMVDLGDLGDLSDPVMMSALFPEMRRGSNRDDSLMQRELQSSVSAMPLGDAWERRREESRGFWKHSSSEGLGAIAEPAAVSEPPVAPHLSLPSVLPFVPPFASSGPFNLPSSSTVPPALPVSPATPSTAPAPLVMAPVTTAGQSEVRGKLPQRFGVFLPSLSELPGTSSEPPGSASSPGAGSQATPCIRGGVASYQGQQPMNVACGAPMGVSIASAGCTPVACAGATLPTAVAHHVPMSPLPMGGCTATATALPINPVGAAIATAMPLPSCTPLPSSPQASCSPTRSPMPLLYGGGGAAYTDVRAAAMGARGLGGGGAAFCDSPASVGSSDAGWSSPPLYRVDSPPLYRVDSPPLYRGDGRPQNISLGAAGGKWSPQSRSAPHTAPPSYRRPDVSNSEPVGMQMNSFSSYVRRKQTKSRSVLGHATLLSGASSSPRSTFASSARI